MEDALAPPADPGAVRARLAALAREGKSAVGLVGHTPSLEECIAAVLGTPRLEMSLSKAGAACVEVPSPESADAPELSWLMSREQLAAVSKATNG